MWWSDVKVWSYCLVGILSVGFYPFASARECPCISHFPLHLSQKKTNKELFEIIFGWRINIKLESCTLLNVNSTFYVACWMKGEVTVASTTWGENDRNNLNLPWFVKDPCVGSISLGWLQPTHNLMLPTCMCGPSWRNPPDDNFVDPLCT